MAADKKHYTLDEQIAALDALDAHRENYIETSTATGIPTFKLHQWRRKAGDLRAQWRRQQQERAAQIMAQAQVGMAEKTLQLVVAMDDERIAKAPLNQLAAALGVLVDRYLKLTDDAPERAEQVIRFEYIHPDGTSHRSPPWADDDSAGEGALQGRGVRATLWQNGTGEADAAGNGAARRRAGVVAGADLHDGAASLAGPEDDNAEHLRYDD